MTFLVANIAFSYAVVWVYPQLWFGPSNVFALGLLTLVREMSWLATIVA